MDKKYILVIAIATLFMIVFIGFYVTRPRAAEDAKIEWVYDFDEGLRQAQQENKYILLDFYADWCGWCKKLDYDTYGNETIASFLNNQFVCVKINIENVTLAQNFNVYFPPAIRFLSSEGEEIGRIEGYLPPDPFMEEASAVTGTG